MKTYLLVAFLAVGSVAQQTAQQSDDFAQETPYEYAYTAESDEGSHGHSEKFDGIGRAEGNYFLKLADGRERHVSYTADENGFHPEIQTNELGTESKNPADAIIISSAPSGPDAAIEAYGGTFPENLSQAPVRTAAPFSNIPQAPANRRTSRSQ
ncbi:cuticle protein 14 [Galendromus occidentalis]|uniref:Cuticle protein 14 n=1 Tax=Galendromus occidentalis TaxID=34638 RepID=A0AAJ6QM49_9ACAR|nr:cuticle protein 14 [Galendromus occidentalis]